jgi:hypothetical protein
MSSTGWFTAGVWVGALWVAWIGPWIGKKLTKWMERFDD